MAEQKAETWDYVAKDKQLIALASILGTTFVPMGRAAVAMAVYTGYSLQYYGANNSLPHPYGA